MKSTGIVRKIDEVGRIVLPKEMRDVLGIDYKDPMEIYADEDKIVLKKYENECVFCGNTAKLLSFKGRTVCEKCKKEFARL